MLVVGFKYSPTPLIPETVSKMKNHLTSTNKDSSSPAFGVSPEASIKVLTLTGTSMSVPSTSSTKSSKNLFAVSGSDPPISVIKSKVHSLIMVTPNLQ